MYGSPEEFVDNLKIYRNFTTSYKYFETKHAIPFYVSPENQKIHVKNIFSDYSDRLYESERRDVYGQTRFLCHVGEYCTEKSSSETGRKVGVASETNSLKFRTQIPTKSVCILHFLRCLSKLKRKMSIGNWNLFDLIRRKSMISRMSL